MGEPHAEISLVSTPAGAQVVLRLRSPVARRRVHDRDLRPAEVVAIARVLRQNGPADFAQRLQFRLEEQADLLRGGYFKHLPDCEAHQSEGDGRLQFLHDRTEQDTTGIFEGMCVCVLFCWL